MFEPLLAGIYSVPIILFLPLYVLFFGLGPGSKIAIGTTISFFPIVLNTIAGFGYVDRIFITAARSMGASDVQMFRYVLLPAAFPVILTGLRIGFTVALLSILGSETIASLAGLGHKIVHLAEGMETATIMACRDGHPGVGDRAAMAPARAAAGSSGPCDSSISRRRGDRTGNCRSWIESSGDIAMTRAGRIPGSVPFAPGD